MVIGIKKLLDKNKILCYIVNEFFSSYKPEKFYMRGPRIQ